METQDKAFLKRLLETFALEAKEHVDNISNGLLELKKSSDDKTNKELIETLFREAHSLKGASRAVNISEIEELCKEMENIFSIYKRSEEKIPNTLIDSMLDSNDLLSTLAQSDEEGRREYKPQVQDSINRLKERYEEKNDSKVLSTEHLNESQNEQRSVEQKKNQDETDEPAKNEQTTTIQSIPKTKQESLITETIRVPVKKLNAIMMQTEELIFAKMVSKRHINCINEILYEFKELSKEQSTGADRNKFSKVESLLNKALEQSKSDSWEVSLMLDRLLSNMKHALMLPFNTLFYTLPKAVHDMAKSVGKEAELEVIGGEIEIDRRILEEMKDPLIHLIRNAVDHGIEMPQERVDKKKPETGNVTLKLVQRSASRIEIIVSDDGAGIDEDKVLSSAVKQKIIESKQVQTLDTDSKLDLVFQSGISTSKIVTDLSGRGLGLSIVKEKAEKLGGSVRVKNIEEGGSEFSVLLPLTMSTFRGILVSVNDQKYIFPSDSTKLVTEVDREEIKNIEGKEMIVIEHEVIPYYYLCNILSIQCSQESLKQSVVVIKFGNDMLAIGVDVIEDEEEVIVKSLGKQLTRVRYISGAAMLSSDRVALILNVSDIFKSVDKISMDTPVSSKNTLDKRSNILVVDDSPTTRVLLQNIIELAGYDVTSASDGLEAYELLKKDEYDLLISDVDMPKMNGFELTKAVRSDQSLSELPVVLVTSLESEDDKQKGMEVGANAYIVKSKFDQNTLMDKIQWLIG